MLVIGIDCGTQSLKALAWDTESEKFSSVSRSYDLIPGLPPGHKEQHPREWTRALEECVQLLRQSGLDMTRVRAIGVSGQQHGLVALDSGHRVLRPAKLWCDTSTAPQCEEIMEAAGGPSAYREEIGNLLPPGYTASKVLWMKRLEPELYSRLDRMLLPHDYLNLYLTGEVVAEPGDASGTGYYQTGRRQWSRRALAWIDPDRDLYHCLPPLIASREAAGEVRPSLLRKWGMKAPVRVSSGGGDNMMGAIGSGNVKAGIVTASLGTSGTLYSYSPRPVIDSRGEVASFCDSTGGWLPLICTMNVTVATEMVRSGFLPGDVEELEKAVKQVGAGSDGLILLPYLEGERVPDVPEGTGVLVGLRPATATPAHLARAAMEGVTLGLRQGLDRMKGLGIDPREIRLIGGASKSRAWRQIAADIFQMPVVCPLNQEGPALGAAFQAFWCLQGGDISDLVWSRLILDEESRCLPSPRNSSLYAELYALYTRLSHVLIDSEVFPAHRRFIHR